MNSGSIETVSLIGLGAVGSSYLARISEAIPMDNIRVIASGERAERYRADGVTVNGRNYKFPVASPDDAKPADLLIFAVKNNHIGEAVRSSRSHVGPDTIILSLLNGVSSERIIADAYGIGTVLYSTVMGIDATRTGDSTVYSSLGVIPFGEPENTRPRSREVALVAEFFDGVGIGYEIPDDMMRVLWKKFMMNVGMNQVSAVLRCNYGAIQSVEPVRALVVSAMTEALAAAVSEGVNVTEDDLRAGLALAHKLSPEGKTSMLQDVEARRPTEVGVFGEAVCEIGLRNGIPTPVNDVLSRIIRAAEASYSS